METIKTINTSRNLTEFIFFYNTPFTNFSNTVHFSSNEERDKYFLEDEHFRKTTFKTKFNFILDKSTVTIPALISDYWYNQGINYCTFIDDFTNTRYYAYVVKQEYVNAKVLKLHLLIDGVMTFTQGNIIKTFDNLTIQRQHLTKPEYEELNHELKNNDDVLQTYSKNYFFTAGQFFNKFIVIFLSSADLQAEFGTANNPKITSSRGTTFCDIPSPLDVYACKYENFNKISRDLSKYPWIAQNIQKIMLVPEEIVNLDTAFDTISVGWTSGLYIATKNVGVKKVYKGFNKINFSMTDLYKLFNIDEDDEKHILRNGYTTCEVYSWDGQKLNIDLGQLNTDTGIEWECRSIIGFANEIHFYLKNYMFSNKNKTHYVPKQTEFKPHHQGTYLNNAISFTNFDSLPILIDNANLSLSKTANQRQLAESKLISNRIQNIANPTSDLQSRFYDTASVLSNINPINILGRFTDEYEYYRNQKAQIKDLSLETPTITSQTTDNMYQVFNQEWGLTIMFSKPDDNEFNKIKNYYKLFGYEVNRTQAKIQSVDNMSVCNYLQFTGDYIIPNVPNPILEQIKIQFENGIRLWKNDNTANPFKQDITTNKKRY